MSVLVDWGNPAKIRGLLDAGHEVWVEAPSFLTLSSNWIAVEAISPADSSNAAIVSLKDASGALRIREDRDVAIRWVVRDPEMKAKIHPDQHWLVELGNAVTDLALAIEHGQPQDAVEHRMTHMFLTNNRVAAHLGATPDGACPHCGLAFVPSRIMDSTGISVLCGNPKCGKHIRSVQSAEDTWH